MSKTNDNPSIKDRWTCSGGYRQAYQNNQQIEAILSLLQLDAAAGLIDVGCGNGVFAIEAARRHPECKVWACDRLQSAIAECRKAASELPAANFEAFIAPTESIPLPNGSADRILMRNMLHHVQDAEAAFAEIARLLKEGGRLVLEGPCNAWDEDTGKLLAAVHMLMDDSHRRTYHRPESIVAMLQGPGLRTESVDSWPYPFSVGQEQAALIRQHNAQETFKLHKRDDGNWSIELNITRIIATRRSCAETGGS